MPNPFGTGVRPWARKTAAKLAASTSVYPPGEIVTDDAGNIYGTDGVATASSLVRHAKVLRVAPVVTADSTALVDRHNPVDPSAASAGLVTITLPTGKPGGAQLSVEKTDTSGNLVVVSGSIRGVTTTITIDLPRETVCFLADAAGSWWPTAGHKTKSALNALYAPLWASVARPRRPDVGTAVSVSDATPTWYQQGVNGTNFTGVQWTNANFASYVRVLGGGTLSGHPLNTNVGILRIDGSGNHDPCELEFWHPGDACFLHLVVLETDGTDIRVFIDDNPTTRQTVQITAAGTYFLHIQSPSAFTKKVRVSLGRAGFVQVIWRDPVLAPTATKPKKRVAVTGDSWSVGEYVTGANLFEGTWIHQLKVANLEVVTLAQAGTGYVNNGSGNTTPTTSLGPGDISHIGSTSRLAALKTQYDAGLRDLIVFGGANDGAGTASVVATAVTAFFAALRTQMPQLRVYVVGIQPFVFSGSAATLDALNTQLKTICDAAPNVVKFIDMRTVPWITGTGTVGTPTGVGNSDRFIAADGVHPTIAGAEWIGTRVLDELALTRTTES